AFHPEGDTFASASQDETIRLWHITGHGVECTRVLTGHDNGVLAVAFSKDGRYLASGSFDKTVRVWDLRDGTHRILTGHTGSTHAVAFGPDSRKLASASTDKTLRVWDLGATGASGGREPPVDGGSIKCLVLEGSPGPVHTVAFHAGGQRLASGGQDN